MNSKIKNFVFSITLIVSGVLVVGSFLPSFVEKAEAHSTGFVHVDNGQWHLGGTACVTNNSKQGTYNILNQCIPNPVPVSLVPFEKLGWPCKDAYNQDGKFDALGKCVKNGDFSFFNSKPPKSTTPLSDWCYIYDPTRFPELTFDLSITDRLQTKIVTLPNQQPPTILQNLGFLAKKDVNAPYYSKPFLCTLQIWWNTPGPIEALVLNSGGVIPMSQPPLDKYFFHFYNSSSKSGSVLNLVSYVINPFTGILSDNIPDRISKEDAIIDSVDATKTLISRFRSPIGFYESYWSDSSVPATNCAKLSGTGAKKVVFMRGNQWNSSLNDYLWKVDEVKTAFLNTDPFKTYQNQFSFYVDLKKQDQSIPLGTTISEQASVAAVKAQSSCGNDAFAYTYFYVNLPKPAIAWDSHAFENVAFIDSSVTRLASPDFVLTSIHELGHAIGGLNDEYKDYDFPVNTFTKPLTNCSLDPFKDYRNQADNHIYGAPDIKRCKYESNPSGKVYYRPNDNSIMNMTGGRFSQLITSNKFDVISCGYIVAGLNGKALTKANALLYWPTCKTYDTAKDGIPPVLPEPVVDDMTPLIPGKQTTVSGSGFSPTGNSILLEFPQIDITGTTELHVGADSFEINNLVSPDGKTLVFTVPEAVQKYRAKVSLFHVKVGALNSDWRNTVDAVIHSVSPTNLTAVAKRGGIDLTWTNDWGLDKLNFSVEKKINNEFVVVKTLPLSEFQSDQNPNQVTTSLEGYPPSATATFRVRAKFWDGTYSDYSNTVTVTTLAKPPTPILFAVAGPNNSIGLAWTIQDASDISKYKVFEQEGSTINTMINSGDPALDRTLTVENLNQGSEHCYYVKAVVNDLNESDASNTACAIAGVGSLEASAEPIEGNSTVSFDTGQTGAQISSIDFTVDGRPIGTDNSAPYSSPFNSTQFTNGPHNLSSTINYVSPRQSIIITPKIIQVQNPLLVTSVTATSTILGVRTFVVNGSGFTATGNKVRLTYVGPVSVLPNIFYKLSLFARSMLAAVAPLIKPIPGATYEITGLTSNGNSIVFTVPSGIPAARYIISVATASEDWKVTNLTITVYYRMSVVAPPTLTSLSPTSVSPGSSIIALGSGFATSANTDKVELTFATSTYSLTAMIRPTAGSVMSPPTGIAIDSGRYTTFRLPNNIPSGTYSVKIANQDSDWSNALTLTVLAPIPGVFLPVNALTLQSLPDTEWAIYMASTASTTVATSTITIATTTVSTFCYTFNRDLGVELPINPEEVTALKTIFTREQLTGENFLLYDESVASKIIEIQRKYSVPLISGYLGPLTRTKLNQVYSCGR